MWKNSRLVNTGSATSDQIQVASDPGWSTGDVVVYHNGGGTSIGGLVDGQTYYAIVLPDHTTLLLAASAADAASGKAVTATPALTDGSGNDLLIQKIDANTHPAGKMDVWRRYVNCLFGLSINGGQATSSNPFDSTGTYSCSPGNVNLSGTPTTCGECPAPV